MERRKGVLLCAVMLWCITLSAQDELRKAFDDFTNSSKAAHAQFTDSVNTRFAETLRDTWHKYGIEELPEPNTQPIPVIQPTDTVSVSNKSLPVMEEMEDIPLQWPLESDSALWTTQAYGVIEYRDVKFMFFGVEQTVSIPYDYGTFHPEGISEADVSDFWKRLSQYDYNRILKQCNKLRRSSGYNDWAIYLWIQALAETIFLVDRNSERAIFTVFIANQAGLMSKVARANRVLIGLFASMQPIYARKYIVVDTYRYYVAGAEPPANDIYTYNVAFGKSTRPLDMRVSQQFKIGGDSGYTTVYKYSTVLKKTLALPINSSLMSFYSHYPQLDVNVYAMATPDKLFTKALIDSIKPVIANMKSPEIVELILRFIQTDFDYRIDMEQFGYEKPFFCEENFIYEYNDCEDRTILFYYLVRLFTGYQTVILDYPGHTAAAVCIEGDYKGDYVKHDGRKYYVCDPSFVGAKIGMTMPDYKTTQAKIWIIN